METLLIGLKNEKAKQLLTDLAALDIIEIQEQEDCKPNSKISELRYRINTKINEEEINVQLQKVRDEWQRGI